MSKLKLRTWYKNEFNPNDIYPKGVDPYDYVEIIGKGYPISQFGNANSFEWDVKKTNPISEFNIVRRESSNERYTRFQKEADAQQEKENIEFMKAFEKRLLTLLMEFKTYFPYVDISIHMDYIKVSNHPIGKVWQDEVYIKLTATVWELRDNLEQLQHAINLKIAENNEDIRKKEILRIAEAKLATLTFTPEERAALGIK